MLLVADLFSLWLCCDAPVAAGQESILGQSEMKLQTGVLFDKFQFDVSDFSVGRAADTGRIEALHWSIAVKPYPCTFEPLTLSAHAMAVPVKQYGSWHELKDASWGVELQWRLHP
jgi:hypothetical protein